MKSNSLASLLAANDRIEKMEQERDESDRRQNDLLELTNTLLDAVTKERDHYKARHAEALDLTERYVRRLHAAEEALGKAGFYEDNST